MDFTKLFNIQEKLDKIIIDTHDLQERDLLDKKILSFQVELGECANEWKGFKFWKVNPEMNRERTLEEYVDCLHFLVSIGLDLGYSGYVAIYNLEENEKIEDIGTSFSVVFEQSAQINYPFFYEMIFVRFIELGELLGFSWEEVEKAYLDKNKINLERQDNGY